MKPVSDGGERWMEVFWCDGGIDVVTRLADEYTNNIAEGFAELAKRFWGGKRRQ